MMEELMLQAIQKQDDDELLKLQILHGLHYPNEDELLELLQIQSVDVNSTIYPLTVQWYPRANAPYLVLAADLGYVRLVDMLLQRGADPAGSDVDGYTALHVAASRANVSVVETIICWMHADVKTEDSKANSPLHLATRAGNIDAIKALANHKRSQSQAAVAQSNMAKDFYAMEIQVPMPLEFDLWLMNSKIAAELLLQLGGAVNFMFYYAVMEEGDKVGAEVLLQLGADVNLTLAGVVRNSSNTEVEKMLSELGVDVNYTDKLKRTPLHWATIGGHKDVVKILLQRSDLNAVVEDEFGRSALQYAVEYKFREIENLLAERTDVHILVESLYRDRQVYVDAANAILVGAALIASVTFAGWLQPPLGYSPGPYAAVEEHPTVQEFWVFNSLSFFFAIATVLVGAGGVLPMPDTYIATAVREVRRALSLAALLLVLSVVFVLGAFSAAGFAALPPTSKWNRNMIGTVVVGGTLNMVLTGWFLRKLYPLRPEYFRTVEGLALHYVVLSLRVIVNSTFWSWVSPTALTLFLKAKIFMWLSSRSQNFHGSFTR